MLGRGGHNWRFKRISIESLPFVARQLYMFCCCCCCFVFFFLKCRDSENYFGFSVDVFSELNQTVNGRFYARDVKIFSKTLKSSRDDFNVLENFNVSSIKTANKSLGC